MGLASCLFIAGCARAGQTRVGAKEGPSMPVKFRTTGCLFSIIASVVLTVALNLLLRACSA